MDTKSTNKTAFLSNCFPSLENAFLGEIEQYAQVKVFAAEEFIVQQGQSIQFLPLVIKGSVKVFSDEDAVQFLLYYITAGASCVYSFAHILHKEPAEFSAVAESDSELLLLPLNRVQLWMLRYPSFSALIIANYQKHYRDLLNTTKQIVCHKLEDRLLDYLRKRKEIENTALLSATHQEIASDLGTSREVISRLLKKLSVNGLVAQEGRKIKVR